MDYRKEKGVDVVGDAHQLPFVNESFDHIYSSHVIEHFSHQDTKRIITEWTRCLKLGGVFEVRCPDLRARALLFFFNPNSENIKNIYGGQDYEGNSHGCGFSYGLLKTVLLSCGITKIKRIVNGYKSIPFLPDCLHIKGIKGEIQKNPAQSSLDMSLLKSTSVFLE
jgi:SAM-dependent methyltransferase